MQHARATSHAQIFLFARDVSVMLNSMLDLSVNRFMPDIWTGEHVTHKTRMFAAIWVQIGSGSLEPARQQYPKLDTWEQ